MDIEKPDISLLSPGPEQAWREMPGRVLIRLAAMNAVACSGSTLPPHRPPTGRALFFTGQAALNAFMPFGFAGAGLAHIVGERVRSAIVVVGIFACLLLLSGDAAFARSVRR